MLVGEYLDLDVAGVFEVALDVDAVVGEELHAFATGAFVGLLEVVRGQGDTEALAATATDGLAGDRISGGIGLGAGLIEVLGGFGGTGHDRHTGLLHDLAGLGLGTHRVDRGSGRADEDDAGLVEGAGEVGVLGQESITGMYGFGTGLLAGADDLLDRQVTLGGDGRTDQVSLVAGGHMRGVAVDL